MAELNVEEYKCKSEVPIRQRSIQCTRLTRVRLLWKQPTLVCQSLSVMEKRKLKKKKKNHHDNPVKGEWSLWRIEPVAWFWFLLNPAAYDGQ